MKPIFLIIIAYLISMFSMNAQETLKINVKVGTKSFLVTTYDNATARAFIALLPLTIAMNDVNGNEKYRPLQSNLPTSPEVPPKINTGDLMLWGANGLVLFYETFNTSYSYSKIGYMENVSGLKEALGTNNPTVTFEVLGTSTGTGMIEQNSFDFKISADGILHFSGVPEKISLFDMNGKILVVTQSNTLDVSNLPKGIYILKAEGLNQVKTIKINI